MTKPDIDKMAMEIVINFERKEGREPKIVTNKGYDLISGNRLIEVKGTTHGYGNIGLKKRQFNSMKENTDWYLYLVSEINSIMPKLYIFSSNEMDENFDNWLVELKLRIPKNYLFNKSKK